MPAAMFGSLYYTGHTPTTEKRSKDTTTHHQQTNAHHETSNTTTNEASAAPDLNLHKQAHQRNGKLG